ncbi:class IV adenylate cyclase [Candidatus Dependentiae bacterium]|nr:class IV adenylate cyclase [Candidatus Dependentiae bacterium]
MNKEIEVKFQLDDKLFSQINEWLNKNAKHVNKINHSEYYLNNPNASFLFTAPEGYKDAKDFLRIRFTKDGDSFCLKKFHEDPIEKRPLYCDEYEVKVSDGKKTLELMEVLGYTEQTLVEKTRNIYTFDVFEIVIDQVTNLGIFMEVELKAKVDNAKIGLNLIYDFLKSIGITKFKLQTRGYTSMLWNPEYDFGKEVVL